MVYFPSIHLEYFGLLAKVLFSLVPRSYRIPVNEESVKKTLTTTAIRPLYIGLHSLVLGCHVYWKVVIDGFTTDCAPLSLSLMRLVNMKTHECSAPSSIFYPLPSPLSPPCQRQKEWRSKYRCCVYHKRWVRLPFICQDSFPLLYKSNAWAWGGSEGMGISLNTVPRIAGGGGRGTPEALRSPTLCWIRHWLWR